MFCAWLILCNIFIHFFFFFSYLLFYFKKKYCYYLNSIVISAVKRSDQPSLEFYPPRQCFILIYNNFPIFSNDKKMKGKGTITSHTARYNTHMLLKHNICWETCQRWHAISLNRYTFLFPCGVKKYFLIWEQMIIK